MRQRIQMHIKYCEPCQMINTRKLDKCPHEMQPVKVPEAAWKQIGTLNINTLLITKWGMLNIIKYHQ